jgi:hypothetical protein
MIRSSLTLFAVLLLASFASAQCQVTRPSDPPYVPPAEYAFPRPNPSFFAYGNDGLWTLLQVDGKWVAYGKDGDGWVYQNKLTFWHRGFNWLKNQPTLTVTAKRLDGDAPTVTVGDASAVDLPNRDSGGMMTLLAVPTVGCWEVTARYEGNELSFVVSVEPKPPLMSADELEIYGDFLDSYLGIRKLPNSFVPTRSDGDATNLSKITHPLTLPAGDKDGCLAGIGFQVPDAEYQAKHEFPADITQGRPLSFFVPTGVGEVDGRAGVLSLSNIGFDKDHQFAVFTFHYAQDAYAKGGTLVFRKVDGKWTLSERACSIWMT